MTPEPEIVGPLLAETLAELSRRPTLRQYEIVVQERDTYMRVSEQCPTPR
jgi:hypothetical protein